MIAPGGLALRAIALSAAFEKQLNNVVKCSASLILMPQSVKERVGKLREEIAEISAANRLYLQGGKKTIGASDQERRLQRLQEIMDELMSLTDWKKP
jgi:TolA-binding protein